ncbi:MAG: hypothetical protein U1F43_37735 [Myxococcota bacterium]
MSAGGGGKGGTGGNGGRGGHGSGGAGGMAYGIYISAASDPACDGLGFAPAGSGTTAVGGLGGDQSGNKGADGTFGDKNKATASCPEGVQGLVAQPLNVAAL